MENNLDSFYTFDNEDPIGSDRNRGSYTNLSPLLREGKGKFMLSSALRYNKRYLLKYINPPYKEDPLYRLVLRKEFDIGIGLDHPNIRQTYALEDIDGVGECLVLEYVDGLPLSEALERGIVNASNARRVCARLADALQYLHAKQIYHRDLKPANILITFAGADVKIIDFSMADSEAFAIIKNGGGTQGYMAPEQKQPGARPTVEADIYSLGIVVGRIAEAVDDPDLRRLASRCSRLRPEDRPHSIAETGVLDLPLTPKKPLIDRPLLTYILSAAVAALAFLTWK